MEISGLNVGYPNICKSWQGEGPFAGQRIVVLRFNVCNLKCHWNTADGDMAWCDTKKTWDGTEKGDTWDVDVLAALIGDIARRKLKPANWEPEDWKSARKPASIVMITGGEPMLRQNDAAFQALVARLHGDGLLVHVETNGTIPPGEWARQNIDFFVVSPKYQLYPKVYSEAKTKEWLKVMGVQVAWKFVVGRAYDLELLRQWLHEMSMPFDADIWLMPLTDDKKDLHYAQNVLEGGTVAAIQILGYKSVQLSPRLQIGLGRDLFP